MVLLAVAACGGHKKAASPAPVTVPARSATAGERVLALAPAGADAVLEIDLRRLRSNRAVGALFAALSESGDVSGNLAAVADLVVFVSYRVGEPDFGQLVFAVGPRATELRGATQVAPDVVAFGPRELIARLTDTASGAAPTLKGDRALLRARALAMPEKASGACLRLSASLGFEARLALARRLEVEAVPAWLSVWIDVADDLAAVGLMGGGDDGDAEELGRAVTRLRDSAAKATFVRRLGLARLVSDAKIEVRGDEVRVVIVIGPRRLAQVVGEVLERLKTREES